jgi:hypothetical protein
MKKVSVLQQEVASLKALLHNLVQQQESEQWLDSADIKQSFHFSESKLYRLRKEKQIPFAKIGGRYVYPKSFFNDLLLKKVIDNF